MPTRHIDPPNLNGATPATFPRDIFDRVPVTDAYPEKRAPRHDASAMSGHKGRAASRTVEYLPDRAAPLSDPELALICGELVAVARRRAAGKRAERVLTIALALILVAAIVVVSAWIIRNGEPKRVPLPMAQMASGKGDREPIGVRP